MCSDVPGKKLDIKRHVPLEVQTKILDFIGHADMKDASAGHESQPRHASSLKQIVTTTRERQMLETVQVGEDSWRRCSRLMLATTGRERQMLEKNASSPYCLYIPSFLREELSSSRRKLGISKKVLFEFIMISICASSNVDPRPSPTVVWCALPQQSISHPSFISPTVSGALPRILKSVPSTPHRSSPTAAWCWIFGFVGFDF